MGSNRWIWVRNGLATKEAVVTDQLLRDILKGEPVLQERQKSFSIIAQRGGYQGSADAYIEEIRKDIAIEFTGADVYSFAVAVKDHDPLLASRINQILVNQLVKIEISRPILAYQTAAGSLKERLERLKNRERDLDPDLITNRRNLLSTQHEIQQIEVTVHQLDIAVMLMEAEKNSRMIKIIEPKADTPPVWPQAPLLHLAALGLGLFLSLLFIYLTMIYKIPGRAYRMSDRIYEGAMAKEQMS